VANTSPLFYSGAMGNNEVVKLCAEGMQAEAQGQLEQARALFEQAWAARNDDFDACVAAHYVARHQTTEALRLAWNQTALDRANAVADDRVTGFFPSLYLNLGHSHEMLGALDLARSCYLQAEARLSDLQGDRYGEMVRDAVARGVERVTTATAGT